MLPYSGLILDNTNNYGIVKTETLFGFGSKNQASFIKELNMSEPLEWILKDSNYVQHHQPSQELSRSLKNASTKAQKTQTKKIQKKSKRNGKGKKCVFKILKKNKRRKTQNKNTTQKRYMMPVILGMIAAKSILVPVALKVLAFISAKGLMMGFFSTILASLLSLKGMFDSHGYQNRKDDSKTQVEIIQVPNHDDHIYHDGHYQRNDYVPNLVSIK